MNESVKTCGRERVQSVCKRLCVEYAVCVCICVYTCVCAPNVHTHMSVYTHRSAIRQQQPALKGAEGCLEIKVITQIEPYGLNISELKFTRQ